TAVAFLHRGKQMLAVRRHVQENLGNAREILADLIAITLRGSTQLVVIDLLVEIHVLLRALAAARITRVIKAAAVRGPGDAAAGGGIGDARDGVGELLHAGHLVDRQRADFTATLRQ